MSVPVRAEPRSTPVDSPRGMALLRDPLLNKGTAFTEAERDALGLRGFLPAHVFSMKTQAERVLANLRTLPNDLAKYVALNELHDRNEALFFRVVCDNIDEIQPLIYTPTVGLACSGLATSSNGPAACSSEPTIAVVLPNCSATGPIRPSLSS
jgi:malate dehydrogenase (oxaloacetate-decarboxylating)(NADP+)